MLFRPPIVLTRIFPTFIWRFFDQTDAIYITFDDGPSPEVTPWVLDQLDKFGAKATFFCLGKNAEMFPDLYAEVIRRGHSTGNHSYSHIKGWGMETGAYIRDVDTAAEFIHSNLFRPPYGRIGPHQAKMLSERYKIVMWEVLSRDYGRSISGKRCARNVIRDMRPGAIVVFHDSVKSARNLWVALPLVLQAIKERGWVCKKIEL
ncbi:MAG: polysaccharide deacetylase family protein [Prevotellaceae bacterium]|jgi:peptidoglycan/xylan/chitin deacetylase (PgdA/CDA1 family)|nr:polysaccharide deacetylase family protein [Prevotellaceae bacterium]